MKKNELIWSRLSEHLDDSYKEYVLEKFQDCFDYSPSAYWNPVIADLVKSMKYREDYCNDVQYKVAQVKMKFGYLRFYVEGADDFLRGCIALAELQCSKICTYCGSYNEKKAETGRFVKMCVKCNVDEEI